MAFEIRPRTEADLEPCAAMLRIVHALDNYPHGLADDVVAWLQPPRQRQAFVAVDADNVIAGHVALNVAAGDPALSVSSAGTGLPPERLAVVAKLFVSMDHRRRGIAEALLDTAVVAAHAQGLRPVLDVLEVNTDAIYLYERAGWNRLGPVVFRSRAGEALPAFVYAGPMPVAE